LSILPLFQPCASELTTPCCAGVDDGLTLFVLFARFAVTLFTTDATAAGAADALPDRTLFTTDAAGDDAGCDAAGRDAAWCV
jgi:hypothetical protein